MSESTLIDEILAARPAELLQEILWEDPLIIAKIRVKLNKISSDNIKYYHKHFVEEI